MLIGAFEHGGHADETTSSRAIASQSPQAERPLRRDAPALPDDRKRSPEVTGAYTILNLYADAARLHGYTQIYAEFESAPTKIELISDKAIGITINFKANGPYNATGAFAVLGPFNNEVTSSSGT